MIFHFIRHAQAIKQNLTIPDEHRYLTSRGRERFRKVAGILRNLPANPEYIFSSPKIRAVQTAEILAEQLLFTGEVIITPLLADCTMAAVRELLKLYPSSRECVVVGHNPDFSSIVGTLLNLSSCSLAKGSAVTLAISTAPSHLSAKIITYITARGELISGHSKALSLLESKAVDEEKR